MAADKEDPKPQQNPPPTPKPPPDKTWLVTDGIRNDKGDRNTKRFGERER